MLLCMHKYKCYLNVKQITVELSVIVYMLLQRVVYLTEFFYVEKFTFYGKLLNSIKCVAIVRKTAEEIIITIFFLSKSFG